MSLIFSQTDSPAMRITTLCIALLFAFPCLLRAADDKKADDPKAAEKKVEPNKADDKKADPKKPDEKKPEEKKSEEKKDDKKTPSAKKDDSKPDKKKKNEDGDGMVSAGDLVGIVKNTGSSKKGITIGVETYELQIQGFRLAPAKVMKDVDFQPTDDMKVRMMNPPAKFENGKVKRYTAKELKEMRGDGKLPGYSADLESLHADQIVQLHLVRKKDAPKPKATGKSKDKAASEDLPQIKMIVILSEVKD
jgi:hypothetical protein